MMFGMYFTGDSGGPLMLPQVNKHFFSSVYSVESVNGTFISVSLMSNVNHAV